MSRLKQGDRVVTTKDLFVVGHTEDLLEAGATGIVLGPTTQENYLTVKLDVVKLPTYIREANLELVDPDPLEDLSFADNHLTVDYWPGNERNKPWVGITIKTGYIDYDRDYNTETEVTGYDELELDEMVKLRDFLNKAIEKAEDWEWRTKP